MKLRHNRSWLHVQDVEGVQKATKSLDFEVTGESSSAGRWELIWPNLERCIATRDLLVIRVTVLLPRLQARSTTLPQRTWEEKTHKLHHDNEEVDNT